MRRGARLGQHFLTTRAPALALAHSIQMRDGETILEIGPGKGALTRVLLTLGKPVIAIEKDEVLVAQLQEVFAAEIAEGRLTIISEDIRNIDPQKLGLKGGNYVVAANIPYYITGEIIRQFLTASDQPRAMALLIQKEVAKRIVAQKESILSLSVKAYGTPRIIQKVSRKEFSPPPSVDSAILLINSISKDFFVNISEKDFFAVVRAGFASKRKFLANNLGVKFGKDAAGKALAVCAIPEKARAENVVLEKWRQLTSELTDSTPSS